MTIDDKHQVEAVQLKLESLIYKNRFQYMNHNT